VRNLVDPGKVARYGICMSAGRKNGGAGTRNLMVEKRGLPQPGSEGSGGVERVMLEQSE